MPSAELFVVSGHVTLVKVGDQVKAGQLLMRLDARAADQNAAASDAQVQAAVQKLLNELKPPS